MHAVRVACTNICTYDSYTYMCENTSKYTRDHMWSTLFSLARPRTIATVLLSGSLIVIVHRQDDEHCHYAARHCDAGRSSPRHRHITTEKHDDDNDNDRRNTEQDSRATGDRASNGRYNTSTKLRTSHEPTEGDNRSECSTRVRLECDAPLLPPTPLLSSPFRRRDTGGGGEGGERKTSPFAADTGESL